MANCAIGSVRGYDEIVPKHLNVVTESRFYTDIGALYEETEPIKTGVIPGKNIFCSLLIFFS